MTFDFSLKIEKLKILKQTISFLQDLLFPISCLGCSKEKTWLCNDCLQKIPYRDFLNCPGCRKVSYSGAFCPACQKDYHLSGLWVAGDYKEGLLKNAIHTFKYQGIKNLALPLGSYLSNFLKKYLHGKDWIIIPIPLHRFRQNWRGFNQAEELAKVVGKNLNIPIRSDILLRKRNTKEQTKLNDSQRAKNIKNAFAIKSDFDLKGRKIILLDDVATTLSTLEEAAKILYSARVKEIWGLVIARG